MINLRSSFFPAAPFSGSELAGAAVVAVMVGRGSRRQLHQCFFFAGVVVAKGLLASVSSSDFDPSADPVAATTPSDFSFRATSDPAGVSAADAGAVVAGVVFVVAIDLRLILRVRQMCLMSFSSKSWQRGIIVSRA